MAKTKSATSARRGYEYDHQYGLGLTGKAVKTKKASARKKSTKRR